MDDMRFKYYCLTVFPAGAGTQITNYYYQIDEADPQPMQGAYGAYEIKQCLPQDFYNAGLQKMNILFKALKQMSPELAAAVEKRGTPPTHQV